MAGMRRSEVSALRWADVADATEGDGMRVTVRRNKTNQEGELNDVRFVKDGAARAIRTLRAATSPEPGDGVVPFSPQMVGLRFTVAIIRASHPERYRSLPSKSSVLEGVALPSSSTPAARHALPRSGVQSAHVGRWTPM